MSPTRCGPVEPRSTYIHMEKKLRRSSVNGRIKFTLNFSYILKTLSINHIFYNPRLLLRENDEDLDSGHLGYRKFYDLIAISCDIFLSMRSGCLSFA